MCILHAAQRASPSAPVTHTVLQSNGEFPQGRAGTSFFNDGTARTVSLIISTLSRVLKSPTVFLKTIKCKPSTGVDIHAACFHRWHFDVLCWDIILDRTGKYYV